MHLEGKSYALAYIAEGVTLFRVAQNLAGLRMGAAQAAGRAIVGRLSPSARTAEFFGLWNPIHPTFLLPISPAGHG